MDNLKEESLDKTSVRLDETHQQHATIKTAATVPAEGVSQPDFGWPTSDTEGDDHSEATSDDDHAVLTSDYDDSDYDSVGSSDSDTSMIPTRTGVYVSNEAIKRFGLHSSDSNLQSMQSANPALQALMNRSKSQEFGGSGVTMVIQTSATPSQTKQDRYNDHPMRDVDPKVLLKSIIESHGASPVPRPYASIEGFFDTLSAEHVAAYDMETVSAVRNNDLDKVRGLHESGKQISCCNKFGETIIHLACRRGYADMVKFLMMECQVSHRVVCDSGRTPMHDACWTSTPSFDCIRLVLEVTPDLLLVADKRGFTPLDYVPRDSWGEWSAFLEDNRGMLAPKCL